MNYKLFIILMRLQILKSFNVLTLGDLQKILNVYTFETDYKTFINIKRR